MPKTLSNFEDAKQVINYSGSVGANFIEADQAFSKKDFIFRVKISRKEAKESQYWLELIQVEKDMIQEKEALIQEALELTKILGSIVQKLT